MGCGDEKLSKYLTQTFTAHCNAMICQQVTLSGDAEWPKVADAVIEACPWMVLVHSVTRGWQDIRFLLGCMGYIAIHTTPEGRRVLPLCIEGRNTMDSKTYPRKGGWSRRRLVGTDAAQHEILTYCARFCVATNS